MKTLFSILFILHLSLSGLAQDVIRQKPCTSETISKMADSIKTDMQSQGFVVLKEAGITMESEYEMPVIVPMTEGTWYHFVFIGEETSRLFEVRMFDWNEKQVVYEKNLKGDPNANIIAYSYIPKFSEYHMIKPVQINKKKKKDLCGYVLLMKKTK